IVSHIRRLVLWPRGFVRPKSIVLPFVSSPSRSRFYPTSADLKCRTRASPSSVGEDTIVATAFVVPHDVKQPVGCAEREQKPSDPPASGSPWKAPAMRECDSVAQLLYVVNRCGCDVVTAAAGQKPAQCQSRSCRKRMRRGARNPQ